MKSTPTEIVWHYTTGEKLALILADGEIIPATEGLPIDTYKLDAGTIAQLEEIVATGRVQKVAIPFKERPAVWFSKRATWEPTATKGYIDSTGVRRTATFEEMVRLADGLVRIGVAVDGLVPWVEHRKLGRVDPSRGRLLVRCGVRMGANPGDWFVHYGPVQRARWVAVQRWDGRAWLDDAESGDHARIP